MGRKARNLQKKQSSIKKKKHTNQSKKDSRNFFHRIYEDQYKKLLIIPFTLLLISLIIIGSLYVQTGDFFHKGITLSGGVTATALGENIDRESLETTLLEEYPEYEINVRKLQDTGTQVGVIVESNILPEDEEDLANRFVDRVQEITGVSDDDLSVETIGASLGDAFFRQTGLALIVAFLFMGIVVFAYFRAFVPSFAVILAAFSNIVMTVAVLNIANFSIGTAGIAAMLMLVGYSVDTDILLTTRMLKEREGSVFERQLGAMRTGLTMSFTTIFAALVTFMVAESQVLREIILIVMIGLIADLINTWLQNAGLLRYYLEKKPLVD